MYKGLKQETRFLYKGFPCVVLFMPGGYRCGYVGLPKENKYYGKSCEKIPVVCHGGITYAQKYLVGQDDKDTYWIGFDCAHFRDGRDEKLASKMYSKDLEMRLYIEAHRYMGSYNSMEARTLEYVENECMKIVDQILEEDKGNGKSSHDKA